MKAMKHTRPTSVRSVSTNTCRQKGEPLTNVKWRQLVEKKSYRRRMWKMMVKEPSAWNVGTHFSCERSKARKFRQLAEEEAGKNTRSVAAVIASQRILGASEMLP